MTVLSYAQNFEDVLLWRALRHVDGGRYVDVGAGHPEHHSVTKLFYDAGWSGINIEPLPRLADALARNRPRDVNIQAAVSSADATEIKFAMVDSWDELSTVSETRSSELRAEGRSVTTTTVPVVRLDTLLAAHGLGDVQFLKVDVEGAELDVLHTLDFTHTRPWIIVVEVVSGSAETSPRQGIRAYLELHSYTHAYFDGLNDFYVSEELADELLAHFTTPVNVTDDFVIASETDRVIVELLGEKLGMSAPVQASEAVQRVDAVISDRIDFETRLRAAEAKLAEAKLAEEGWRLKAETLEQTSFERERMVAWYAAEVGNLRKRGLRQQALGTEQLQAQHAQAALATVELRAQHLHAHELQSRLDDVLASTSWRITLPLRAIRRPGRYIKARMLR